MQYVDLAIRISAETGKRYRVSVTSPEGSCESELELPFKLAELAGVVQGVAQTVRGAATTRDLSPVASEAPLATTGARAFGVTLYRSLFSADVQSLLDRTLGSMRGKKDAGVRVRLVMDMQREGMAELACLPWELIARDPTELPLVMSTKTVLVRSLDVLRPGDPIPFEPPLRILAVVSNPPGTAPLQLEEERDRITKSWGRLPGVRVDFARPVVSELLNQLAAEDYHVLHYMGHGDFDRSTGHGALLLQHEDGSPHLVDADQLRVVLADESLLRLVFLNACKTATTSDRSGLDPFAGIASALIRIGVPAVVAMQFPISDRAAITFADTFYRRIADGYPVDTAVAEGRKALWGGDHAEWATPVLFMRSADGLLFDSSALPAARPAAAAAAQVAATAPPAAVVASATAATVSTPAVAAESAPAETGFNVFLAAPSERLRATHRQLTAELTAAGITVVGAVPPPFEQPQHEQAVREAVRAADLCVHLLGDRPGEPFDEAEPSRTYTLEQLRIGLESARSQLILMSEHLDPAAIEDKPYAELLRSLMERPREAGRFELVSTGRHQMRDEILAKRRRLEEAKQGAAAAGAGVNAAFVDLHASDMTRTTDLITYLAQRQIAPIMIPSTDMAPTASLSLFEENLKKVPLFLVVFGGVAREWVLSRLNAAAQVVTLNGLSTRIGVYLAPPVKNADQLRFPPFFDVIQNMSHFDAGSLDALIRKAGEGEA
jgi:hypothetical protein